MHLSAISDILFRIRELSHLEYSYLDYLYRATEKVLLIYTGKTFKCISIEIDSKERQQHFLCADK